MDKYKQPVYHACGLYFVFFCEPSDDYDDDVAVFLQASTSPSSDTPSPLSKLDRVKLFVELLIKAIRNDDMLSIVTFGTTARVVQPLRRMTDDAKVIIIITSRYATWFARC